MNMKGATHPGFIPLSVLKYKLKNRFIVAPMSRVSATHKGVPTDNMTEYYTAFARGGFSMIVTEGLYTDNYYAKAYPNQPGIVSRKQVKAWQGITSAVQQAGGLIIAQLMHAGALSQCLQYTAAPSAVQPMGKKMKEYGGGDGPFPLPVEMSEQAIQQAIVGFTDAAQNAEDAGFNGIEIHGANGYLLDQFLTSYSNLRQDRWGSSIRNRLRIIKEIIVRIRREVSKDFIVGLRLSEGKVNYLSYRWPEGPSMARAILQELKNTKPDYLHIAAESGNWKLDCTYHDGTSLTSLAKEILRVPVVANGGLHNLDLSRQVLNENHADLLAIGTAALADPSWPQKVNNEAEPLKFHPKMIKPVATIEHTWEVQNTMVDS